MSYGTTITYNGIQWRHNTLQWDQYATTYLARDHNNSQWRTMETQGITMGPMRDNIPCKVTTEHSAFPDEYDMITIHYSQKFYLIIIGQPYESKQVLMCQVCLTEHKQPEEQ